MPGVLILEALAQAAGILAFVTAGVEPDEIRALYFVGIDKARFRRPVEPGDQLILNATFERCLHGHLEVRHHRRYVGDKREVALRAEDDRSQSRDQRRFARAPRGDVEAPAKIR